MNASFHIVGVGASAGGLEALSTLMANVDPRELAMVVVQHRAPHANDALAEILARAGSHDVVSVTDNTTIVPNRIYVAPPSIDIGVMEGTLHLMGSPTPRTQLPIDFFFRTLAADRGSQSVGIVLSGTGSDGTFGLKAIKEAGGITFAQQPSSAKFDGMPTSALDSGWADIALAPDALGKELTRLAKHPYMSRLRAQRAPSDALTKLLVLLRDRLGVDLSSYKPQSLERRVERRAALAKLERIEDYVRHVQNDEQELRALHADLLVNVTSFFRDHDPFDALKTTVFPRIFEKKPKGSTFRAWVPACSTGEEAYSLAIALFEHLGERANDYRFQIFGTDLDAAAIERARKATYPENIRLDVSEERLERFFTRRGDNFQVARTVRDHIIFSTQNVLRDAPLSRMDLVCCRNVLIYLQPVAQRRVLEVINYALEPNGFLMLGTSETIGDATQLFTLFDRTNKIYGNKRGERLLRSLATEPMERATAFVALEDAGATMAKVTGAAARVLLQHCTPPSAIVNEKLEVLHFMGGTAPFLQPTIGAASLSLLKLARVELHADLRFVIREAIEKNAASSRTCSLEVDGMRQPVRIEALPLEVSYSDARVVLLLFHRMPANVDLGTVDTRFAELEEELSATKTVLQQNIEEIESTNEELKSSNDELQASNEALHCVNEELETSREALQASIEELSAMNQELSARASDTQVSRDDLTNVLGPSEAVVVVDLDGRVLRVLGGAAERLLGLSTEDIGAHVATLDRCFSRLKLASLASEAMEGFTRQTVEDVSSRGATVRVQCAPYVSHDRTIGGAIILVNIVQRPETAK